MATSPRAEAAAAARLQAWHRGAAGRREGARRLEEADAAAWRRYDEACAAKAAAAAAQKAKPKRADFLQDFLMGEASRSIGGLLGRLGSASTEPAGATAGARSPGRSPGRRAAAAAAGQRPLPAGARPPALQNEERYQRLLAEMLGKGGAEEVYPPWWFGGDAMVLDFEPTAGAQPAGGGRWVHTASRMERDEKAAGGWKLKATGDADDEAAQLRVPAPRSAAQEAQRANSVLGPPVLETAAARIDDDAIETTSRFGVPRLSVAASALLDEACAQAAPTSSASGGGVGGGGARGGSVSGGATLGRGGARASSVGGVRRSEAS